MVFLFILAAFLINTLHTQFPDEFDNIYGGFLIDHGKLPYTGFFTHHNPGAYYLASIITLFTGRSFVWFRILFAFLLFAFYGYSYYLLKKRLAGTQVNFFLFYGYLIAVGATFWWGQMLLSETIVGYLLVPVFLLIIIKKLNHIAFDLTDLNIISVFTFFSLFISLTYIYLIPFVDIIALYFYFQDKRPVKISNFLKPLLIFGIPYLVLFAYLIITRSLFEFYFASIYYNVNYYIYNFPKVAGTYSHNPARYALSIAKSTNDSIFALLTQVNSFNFSYPFNISLALGNVALIIYLLFKKQYALIVLLVSMIFYTNARSEPLNIHETDFHATVFIMITLALTSYLFSKLKEELSKKYFDFEKIVLVFIFLLTGIYWFFNTYSLTNKFLDKAYGKYMGRDPLIYDRPQTAPTLNKLLTADDYFWIGPFELQELLFIKGKIASKYFWFLPANSRDEKIKREITADLWTNRPKVIVFKKWWANFGVMPEDFNGTIVNILNTNYFQLSDLKKEGLKFKVIVPKERDFDFENEYFFDKSRKAEIIQELFDKGLIQKSNL